MKIKNTHLIIFSALLFILYLLSFLSSDKDSRKVIKTALINPKYKAEISQIELGDQASKVILVKKNDFWFVKTFPESSDFIPAEQDLVESLLNELIKIRKLYKISDKIPKYNHFSLGKDSIFYIKPSYNESFSEFYFGSQDFSQVFRYFMTGRNTKVYQIDSSFEPLLTASQNFWCEKTIISKALLKITSNDDIQSVTVNGEKKSRKNPEFPSYVKNLLELRHGGVMTECDYRNNLISSRQPSAVISIELGNKNTVNMKVHSIAPGNQEYLLFTEYENEQYQSIYKISGWTLSKLLMSE